MTKRWTLAGLGLVMALTTPLNLFAQDAKKADDKAAAPVAAKPVDPAVLLKAIPADAAGFIAMSSLAQLDQHIQDSAKAVNMPNTIPSIVPMLKGALKMGKGFDENGSMAIVLLNISKVAKQEELESRLLFLFPATDAKALAEAMGAEGTGDVLKVDLAGEPAFASVRGDFVAVGKKEEAIKALAEAKGDGLAKNVPAERQKAYAQQDVYGWFNLGGVSKELVESVAEEFEKNVAGTPMAGLVGSIDQIKGFVEQGQEIAFGLSLDAKKGISGHIYVSMKPDTEMGKQMAGMKPASGSLLAGLPDDPFVLAIGAVCSPDIERQVKKGLDLLLSEETVGDKIDKEKLGQIKGGLVKLIGSVEQLSMGVYGTKSAEGQGMVNATLVAKVKDSAQWKQDAKKLFTLAKDVIAQVAKKEGENDEKAKQALDAIQWKDNAEKAGDVEVDMISVDLSKFPDAQAEEVDQAKKVLGPEGVTIRIGAVGKDKIVVAFGGGSKRFEAIAKLATSDESPLTGNKSVKVVADRVAQGPKLAEGYVNIDKLFELVMDIGNELGGGFPFPIKLQNAAPISVTSQKVGDAAQKSEVLIPMELIKSVVDAVRPFLGGMGGPQGGPSEPDQPSDKSELK